MPFGLHIESVEWHSRIEQDWYAATVTIDLLAFLYAGLFYQVRAALTGRLFLPDPRLLLLNRGIGVAGRCRR